VPELLAPAQQQAAAGRLLLRELQGNVQRRTDFALETTLAGRGYLKLVDSLRADAWRVELIYLALRVIQHPSHYQQLIQESLP
jgi:predicted ABC-type ATPase